MPEQHPLIARALGECKRAFWAVAIFSGIYNILMLAGPLYMLQIYDRVLASRSVPTLIALTFFLLLAYAFQAFFDLIRSRIVSRVAGLLDDDLASPAHDAIIKNAAANRSSGEAVQPVRDLDSIRTFLTSTGPIAIVDLPWIPLFLLMCFLIHFWIGLLATLGGAFLFTLALMTERSSRAPAQNVMRTAGTRNAMMEGARRNSETVVTMGMTTSLAKRWLDTNGDYLRATQAASDVTSTYGSVSKVFRLVIQSAILGLGAYLVIRNELSAGSMIASSIMMGRALAPIETAIANWRAFVSARQSVARLSATFAKSVSNKEPMPLPAPTSQLDVEDVAVAVPGSQNVLLQGIRFRLSKGESVAIIGPSGTGKTSLIRTISGIWPPARGTIRLDGATIDQWDRERLGQHIGYISQQVDLFEGTVGENIARMTEAPSSDQIIAAAQAAGAHEMILRLPKGYDTPIGDAGSALSAGQRQRIALARALYGNPFLIILDEPHANLDNDGETALNRALLGAKQRGAIVIIIAHRPSALASCDKILLLANGTQQAFGPRDEILAKLAQPRSGKTQSGLKAVPDRGGAS